MGSAGGRGHLRARISRRAAGDQARAPPWIVASHESTNQKSHENPEARNGTKNTQFSKSPRRHEGSKTKSAGHKPVESERRATKPRKHEQETLGSQSHKDKDSKAKHVGHAVSSPGQRHENPRHEKTLSSQSSYEDTKARGRGALRRLTLYPPVRLRRGY